MLHCSIGPVGQLRKELPPLPAAPIITVMLRSFLFLLTNALIVGTITAALWLSGYDIRVYESTGLNLKWLAITSAIYGFGGALLSLFLSKGMAIRAMRVEIIEADFLGEREELLKIVHGYARKAGLRKMPQVGIYPSAEVNAFATGVTRNSSLVAVSRGLLDYMNKDELKGVIAHEVAHIANGDMVTMTLLQGILNSFVMFFARVIAIIVAAGKDKSFSRGIYYLVNFLLTLVLGFFSAIIMAWFSRYREFRADAGSARLAGSDRMVAALRSLVYHSDMKEKQANSYQAFKISSTGRLMALFATHPPLQKRIKRLQSKQHFR